MVIREMHATIAALQAGLVKRLGPQDSVDEAPHKWLRFIKPAAAVAAWRMLLETPADDRFEVMRLALEALISDKVPVGDDASEASAAGAAGLGRFGSAGPSGPSGAAPAPRVSPAEMWTFAVLCAAVCGFHQPSPKAVAEAGVAFARSTVAGAFAAAAVRSASVSAAAVSAAAVGSQESLSPRNEPEDRDDRLVPAASATATDAAAGAGAGAALASRSAAADDDGDEAEAGADALALAEQALLAQSHDLREDLCRWLSGFLREMRRKADDSLKAQATQAASAAARSGDVGGGAGAAGGVGAAAGAAADGAWWERLMRPVRFGRRAPEPPKAAQQAWKRRFRVYAFVGRVAAAAIDRQRRTWLALDDDIIDCLRELLGRGLPPTTPHPLILQGVRLFGITAARLEAHARATESLARFDRILAQVEAVAEDGDGRGAGMYPDECHRQAAKVLLGYRTSWKFFLPVDGGGSASGNGNGSGLAEPGFMQATAGAGAFASAAAATAAGGGGGGGSGGAAAGDGAAAAASALAAAAAGAASGGAGAGSGGAAAFVPAAAVGGAGAAPFPVLLPRESTAGSIASGARGQSFSRSTSAPRFNLKEEPTPKNAPKRADEVELASLDASPITLGEAAAGAPPTAASGARTGSVAVARAPGVLRAVSAFGCDPAEAAAAAAAGAAGGAGALPDGAGGGAAAGPGGAALAPKPTPRQNAKKPSWQPMDLRSPAVGSLPASAAGGPIPPHSSAATHFVTASAGVIGLAAVHDEAHRPLFTQGFGDDDFADYDDDDYDQHGSEYDDDDGYDYEGIEESIKARFSAAALNKERALRDRREGADPSVHVPARGRRKDQDGR